MAPPRRRQAGKPKVQLPEETIEDISAYLEKVAEGLVAGAQNASSGSYSTDATGSTTGSSYYSRRKEQGLWPYDGGRHVFPEPPLSPRTRMVEEFQRRTEESGDWLQKWYSENYEKVEKYEYIRFELLYFLSEYMPGIKVDENIDARNLVELVKELVQDMHRKFNKFNLELREISGHEIAGYIQDHRRKVLEVVEDYENKLKSANEELTQCKEQIVHLDAELSAALQRMMYLERGTAYYGGFEDSLAEEDFMADLQSRVAHSDSLNSSMKAELEKERQQNEGLQKQLAHLAKEKVETEEKCMQEIVDISSRSEINSMLERGIKEMMEGGVKEPNPQDCQNLVDKWKNEINQVIEQNSKEISELLQKAESQSKEMASLQAKVNKQDEQLQKMQTLVQNKKSLYEKYKAEAEAFQTHVDEVKKVIEELHHESYGLKSFWGRGGAGPGEDDDLEIYNLDDKIKGPTASGGVDEHDLLADTLPIRKGQRERRRLRRQPLLYPSSPSSEEASSVEEPPLPMGGLGPIRIEDEDEWTAVGGESPVEQDSLSESHGQLRFVDGQWIQVEESEDSMPLAAPHREPPSGTGLMGPVRLDQTGFRTVGGRQSPVEQALSGGAMRVVDGQWVSAAPRSPQRLSPPRLHSTLRVPSPGRSRIPVSPRALPPGPDVSSILAVSQRSRTPTRLAVPGTRPTTARTGIRPRLEVPGPQLTVPRAGTVRRLGASDRGPTPTRQRAVPRAGTSVMGPSTARGGAAPRGTSGMRPAASRPGTPPRPHIPTQRPTVTRGRTPQRSAIPSLRPTGARTRPPQRQGAASLQQPPATPADALMSRVMLLSPPRQGAPSFQQPPATPADALMSRVMLLSPQRQEPIALDVDVAPQNIIPSGDEFVCEVAVGVHPAPSETGTQNARRGGRGRRPRPHFTPRTSFRR